MGISLTVTNGEDIIGADIHDCAPEDMLDSLRVASQLIYEKIIQADIERTLSQVYQIVKD